MLQAEVTKKTGAKRRKACSRKFLKLFLANAKVLIRNPSESFSFSPFPAIPSHSQPIPSLFPRLCHGVALR
jgi:hypothetical protein